MPGRDDVKHLVERLHEVEVLDAAALTLDAAAVVAEVLERRRHRGAGVAVEDQLPALLAVQARVAARRRRKHVVRVHRADHQRRAGPRHRTALAPQ